MRDGRSLPNFGAIYDSWLVVIEGSLRKNPSTPRPQCVFLCLRSACSSYLWDACANPARRTRPRCKIFDWTREKSETHRLAVFLFFFFFLTPCICSIDWLSWLTYPRHPVGSLAIDKTNTANVECIWHSKTKVKEREREIAQWCFCFVFKQRQDIEFNRSSSSRSSDSSSSEDDGGAEEYLYNVQVSCSDT